MLFDKNHTQDFLLDANVDPMIAAQVATSLDGVVSASTAQLEDQVQFDFVVPSDRWPAISAQLRAVPSSMIEIEDVPSSNGRVIEATVWVNKGELTQSQAEASLRAMGPTDDVDFNDVITDDDEQAIHNSQ
jgi:hypothetical protein